MIDVAFLLAGRGQAPQPLLSALLEQDVEVGAVILIGPPADASADVPEAAPAGTVPATSAPLLPGATTVPLAGRSWREALAEVLAAGSGPLALLHGDVMVNGPALAAVLDDPRVATAALAGPQGGPQAHLGVMRIDGPDRSRASAALSLPASARPADLGVRDGDDPLLDLTAVLQAAGIAVSAVPLGGYAWARPRIPSEEAEAEQAVRQVDERRVRLRDAVRPGDGFYSSFVVRRLSWRATGVAVRLGVSPNQVTLASLGLGLAAAACFAAGARTWAVLGAVLLQACLVLDCVDGELARYRRRFSALGGWLDATTDRVKEFAAISGLALGSARSGTAIWGLAAAAIGLQSVRHLLADGWRAQRQDAAAAAGPAPGSASGPAPGSPSGAGPTAVRWVVSEQRIRPGVRVRTRLGWGVWLRRIASLPLAERFTLLSLGAVFWTARGTLAVLLGLGLLSLGYMLAAFAVRARSSSAPGALVCALPDVGRPLGALFDRLTGGRAGRVAALLPAGLAAGELAGLWLLCRTAGGARPGAVLVLLAVTATAYYQRMYVVLAGRGPSAEGDPVGGGSDRGIAGQFGTEFRLLAAALLVAVPGLLDDGAASPLATAGTWLLAAVVAVTSGLHSLRGWRSAPIPQVPQALSRDPHLTAGPR